MKDSQEETAKKVTNSKPIPHIPLPFKEVITDVLKVKPPEKPNRQTATKRNQGKIHD